MEASLLLWFVPPLQSLNRVNIFVDVGVAAPGVADTVGDPT